ncbi:hypothetical protein [Phaffia rhodozyma]|uniref:Uncharacterized protein n=1 Tax=Phaffia rhodozyma TaxID=264483 RepID=A0A0F7SQ01_PHARH|nr:hypothetical protein [Phaffia rhodozyma]
MSSSTEAPQQTGPKSSEDRVERSGLVDIHHKPDGSSERVVNLAALAQDRKNTEAKYNRHPPSKITQPIERKGAEI